MSAASAAEAPPWNRFAHWRRGPALLLVAVVAVLLALAATTDLRVGGNKARPAPPKPAAAKVEPGARNPADRDLVFYDRIVERIQNGESYYAFIVDLQRASDYPVKPGLTVRLPTLAFIAALLREPGLVAASVLLLLATVWAWWRRLGEEPGGRRFRALGCALLLVGGSLVLNRYYHVMHELWTGMLMALALGLHRPGRWRAAFAVAALALFIREHVLPLVLLFGAMAAWRRDWREAAAWAALVAVFAAVLAWHIAQVTPQVRADDLVSPPWLVLRGLRGWLSNVVLASNLRFLPHALAGPLVLLMLLGWAGWKSPLGTTATFFFGGYGLLFMIAGRDNNFYWGGLVAPAMFVGLAFLPPACAGLWRALRRPPRAGPAPGGNQILTSIR